MVTVKAFSLILPVILIAATLLTVRADVTDALIGKWSGTATTISRGVTVPQKITTVFQRLENSGLIATTTVKIAGQPTVIGTTRYHDDGKVDGEAKQNGAVVAVVSGSWGSTGKILKATVQASGVFPSFRLTSKTTLVSADRITIVGTASNGNKTVGALRRR